MSQTSFVSLKGAAEGKLFGDGVTKATSFNVKPEHIVIKPGFNRPIDRANVDQFKAAIRGGATIPPIYVSVEDSAIVMVDGEHRILAVRELIAEGMDIPSMAAIQFRGNDADKIAHLITSAQGKALSPLDAGIQYLKLLRLNWSVAQIAARIGKSDTHISTCLALAESNSDVHEHVRNGDVSGSTAAKIVKEHGSKAGAVIKEKLATAKDAGKKARVTPKAAQAEKTKGPTKREMAIARAIAAYANVEMTDDHIEEIISEVTP